MRLTQGARTGFFDFLHWWVGELKTLIPARLRDRGRAPLEIRRGANAEWDKALDALRRERRGARRARLLLDPALCLVRTARLPAAALNCAGDILALELERITPFSRGEVCFGWQANGEDASRGQIAVTQAIVKRDILAPLLGDLYAVGLERVAVVCRLADGGDIAIRLPPELARNNSTPLRLARTLNKVALAVIAVSVCAFVWLAFARQADAIARLDAEIASAQTRAVAVRAKYDAGLAAARGILDLRDKKSTNPPVTALVEELTRILPDDAWLSELHVDGNSVEIVGHAQSAATLTVLLDRSDFFTDVKLVSPVVRSPADNTERFDIALQTVAKPEPLAQAGTQ